MSSVHALSAPADSAATNTARCFIMRMCMSPPSEREPRAQRPGARNGIATEIEAAVGGRRLHRADAAGVRAEKIDLRIVAAVLRPDVEIAARQSEVDTVTEVAPNWLGVERIARRELAQLHEGAVLDPVFEDALRARIESGWQFARISIGQELALVRLRVARDARVLRARRQIHDLVPEDAVEQRAQPHAPHQRHFVQERTSPLRIRVADDLVERIITVAVAERLARGERRTHVDGLIAATITAKRVEQELTRYAIARGVRAVEHAGWIAGSDAVRITTRRLEVLDAQTLDEVLVVRVGDRGRPIHVAAVVVLRAQQQLDPLVRHRSDRRELAREASARRQRSEEEQIGHEAVVVRRLGRHPALEEAGVGADLPLTRALIAQIGVSVRHVVGEARTAGKRLLSKCDVL